MGKNPLVSIIIPVYNGSNYLSQSIDSALSQTYSPIEVIVVNDGSSDAGKTKSIADKYNGIIRYFEKENGGVASALNLGISKMRGDFFSWLSHDDLYYPQKIEKQVRFYQSLNKPKSIVFSHDDQIDAAGNILFTSNGYKLGKEPIPYTLLYSRFISACSLLIPKSAFDMVGLFDPKYITVQDYDLIFRMLAVGYSFEYCPITSGMSRKHGDQDSTKRKELHEKEKDYLFSRIPQFLSQSIWLDPLKNKVWAVFMLSERYRKQHMMNTYSYYRTWLGKGISENNHINRILEIIEYRLFSIMFFFLEVIKKIIKTLFKFIYIIWGKG